VTTVPRGPLDGERDKVTGMDVTVKGSACDFTPPVAAVPPVPVTVIVLVPGDIDALAERENVMAQEGLGEHELPEGKESDRPDGRPEITIETALLRVEVEVIVATMFWLLPGGILALDGLNVIVKSNGATTLRVKVMVPTCPSVPFPSRIAV